MLRLIQQVWVILLFQGLIPDIKPSLKLAEPVTEEMDYEDDEEMPTAPTEPQEDTRDVKIQRTVVQVNIYRLSFSVYCPPT